jgi:ADP-heptose:LPS heptosyltransferase
VEKLLTATIGSGLTVDDRLPSGARIAVIRLRSLGDCVLTTPALALLKQHRPDLKLTVIVESRFAAIFEGNPDVDEIRSTVRSADLALNFHGGTRSMLMTLRSPIRTGFGHHAYSFLYTHRIPRAQEILGVERPVHTAEHLASAIFWLGVPMCEIPRAKLVADPFPQRRAVIHPFASVPDKAWPADRFVEIARRLQNPVILAGPHDDVTPFADFEVWKDQPLAQVKRLLSAAHVFIGNDSGPAHIAAAFGVPVVVIFGPSDPVTWAPWRTESHVLRSGNIGDISIDDVSGAMDQLRVRA